MEKKKKNQQLPAVISWDTFYSFLYAMKLKSQTEMLSIRTL